MRAIDHSPTPAGSDFLQTVAVGVKLSNTRSAAWSPAEPVTIVCVSAAKPLPLPK